MSIIAVKPKKEILDCFRDTIHDLKLPLGKTLEHAIKEYVEKYQILRSVGGK